MYCKTCGALLLSTGDDYSRQLCASCKNIENKTELNQFIQETQISLNYITGLLQGLTDYLHDKLNDKKND